MRKKLEVRMCMCMCVKKRMGKVLRGTWGNVGERRSMWEVVRD